MLRRCSPSRIGRLGSSKLCIFTLGFFVSSFSFWSFFVAFGFDGFASLARPKPPPSLGCNLGKKHEQTDTKSAYTRRHLSNSRSCGGKSSKSIARKLKSYGWDRWVLSCQLQCLGLVWPSKRCALTSFTLFSCWQQSFTWTAMGPSKNISPCVGLISVLLHLLCGQATPQTMVRTFKNVWCQNHLGIWWELIINLKKQHHKIWQFLEDHGNAFGHSWPFQCRICAEMRVFGWIWKGLWLVGVIVGLWHA